MPTRSKRSRSFELFEINCDFLESAPKKRKLNGRLIFIYLFEFTVNISSRYFQQKDKLCYLKFCKCMLKILGSVSGVARMVNLVNAKLTMLDGRKPLATPLGSTKSI